MKIQNKILKDKTYAHLKNEEHHGTSRYAHCKRVMEKAIELYGEEDEEVASGALLHDYFFNYQTHGLTNHFYSSLHNARQFGYNDWDGEVERIILSHMWPIAGKLPRSKKQWCVNIADKIISVKEWFELLK